MKKLLIVLMSILLLSACSSSGDTSDAITGDLPSGFTFVSDNDLHGDYITVGKHEETGCYYTFVNGGYDTSVGVTQMFIEVDGVSVPYCE